jgi:hypothetical protein
LLLFHRIDIMYYDNIKKNRRILNFKNRVFTEYGFDTLFLDDPQCDGNNIYNKIKIPTLHSSAYVDLDADCVNDLLIMSARDSETSYLEIWRGKLNNGKLKFCVTKNSVYTINKSLGHFTIADINRDGLLDITFPILGSSKVLIALNKLDLKYDWATDDCEKFYINNGDLSFPEIFDNFDLNPPESSVNITT